MDALADSERDALLRLYRAIRHFRAMLGPTVPAPVIQAYLAVALNEGRPLKEYAARMELNLSSVSRHLAGLSGRPSWRGPELSLVTRNTNPADEREKLIALSPQGKLMRRLIVETVAA